MSISEGSQISSTVYNNAHGILTTSSTVGCFSEPTPLVDHGPYRWQSSGNCQNICAQLNMPVFALAAGSNCSCASQFPSKSSLTNMNKCNHVCNGYKEDCGGTDTWLVFLTGLSDRDVSYIDAAAPNKGSGSSSSSATDSTITVGGQTIVKTVPGSASTDSSSKSSKSHSGSNTGGIVAGVVVGIVLLAAIIIGVLLYLRRRRRIQAEQEYQNQQNVQEFVVGGNKNPFANPPRMNDSRLDQAFMSSRRQSDGSIMDNQDYSRRILQVTNPDGR